MKVLITGAGGFLGRCMTTAFSHAGHTVMAARHVARTRDESALDITNESECVRRTGEWQPDWIINCAAQRNPDRCVTHPIEAYQLNAIAVEHLARAAIQNGAGLCHISSDYVFSGSHPPYRETDAPTPVILYGRTKLAGEFAAQSVPRHLIIRIPALYRLDLLDPANVVTFFANTLREGRDLHLDRVTARYYTLADEVAAAVEFLLSTGRQGIIHLSSQERSTKADFAEAIATALGMPTRRIKTVTPTPGSLDRPLDTHLDASLYRTTGGPAFTNLTQALEKLHAEQNQT